MKRCFGFKRRYRCIKCRRRFLRRLICSKCRCCSACCTCRKKYRD